ncbi:J domain-containing protein [Bacillus sp. ISL-47]|nr:J domain-containing protein [Bacillus sp. ISL-47]
MNVMEAAEQLKGAGIFASDQDVVRLIEEGKIKAERNQRRKTAYKIKIKDLTDFIIQKQAEEHQRQLECILQEVKNLKGQIEILQTRINIEESKVRSLKKMIHKQHAISGSDFHPAVLLGLNTETDEQLIKKEFKKLLKALHPDRGGDERLFKVFNEHYSKMQL